MPGEKSWRELLQEMNFIAHPQIMKDEVKQYFHPEENVLPKTNERPTSLTNPGYDFRSLGSQYPPFVELPSEVAGKSLNELQFPYKINEPVRSLGVKEQPLWYKEGTDVGEYMGLGQSTKSIGIGPSGKPYLSVYDLWDFAGDPYRSIFTKGGTPYSVYDRIPIPMSEGKFPQYINTSKRGDIELLPEKGIGPRRTK